MPTVRLHNRLKQDVTVVLVDESRREYSQVIGGKQYADVPAESLTKDAYHKTERGILKLRVRTKTKIGTDAQVRLEPEVSGAGAK